MAGSRRIGPPLWLRISLGIMTAVAVLLIAAVALRFWIMSEPGRAFLVSQIDGRKLGSLGALRVSGLTGDPLSAGMVSDIALVDEKGVWLRAHDVRFEWTATSLLAGELDIDSLSVRLLDVLRPPPAGGPDETPSGPDINIHLEQFAIETLRLAQPVLGVEARYGLRGAVVTRAAGLNVLHADLSPLSGPADAASLKLEWGGEGVLKGEATLVGPPGGLISQILQAPGDRQVSVDGRLEGLGDSFTGEASVSFSGEPALTVTIGREAETVSFSGDIRPVDWPLLSEPLARAGGAIQFRGEVAIADASAAPATLELSAPAGEARLNGLIDFLAGTLVSPVTLKAEALNLATLAPPLSGLAEITGDLSVGAAADFTWQGQIAARELTWPSGAASTLSGSLELRKEASLLSWRSGPLQMKGTTISIMPELGRTDYSVMTAGEVNLRSSSLEVYDTRIEGSSGVLTARGAIDGRSGALDFRGSAQLQAPGPVSGAISARWSIRRAASDAPVRVELSGEGRDIRSTSSVVGDLLGTTAGFEFRGSLESGLFRLERGRLEVKDIITSLSGEIGADGGIAGEANVRVSRPRNIAGIHFSNVSLRVDLTGSTRKPRLEGHLDEGQLIYSSIEVERLGGRLVLELGETVMGDFNLTGAALGQSFTTAGTVSSHPGGVRLSGLRAELGQLRASASRIDLAQDGLSADVEVAGPLAGLADIERGTLALTGSLSLESSLSASLTGRISDLRSRSARFDSASFTGKISGNTATLRASLRGQVTAPIAMDMTLTGQRDEEDGWRGEARLTGDIDGLPVSTPRPALWRLASKGWSIESAVSAFGGALVIDAGSSGGQSSLSADIRDLSLRPLSRLAQMPPLNGVMSGVIAFHNSNREAAGDLRLKVLNANPAGVTTSPVSLDLRASMNGRKLNGSATGSGQGFSLDATLSLPMRIGEGFDVGIDDGVGLSAGVMIKGRAEKLWALFGPEDQTLSGEVTASVSAQGSVRRPSLAGDFRMREGAYEHSETGLRLNGISAAGRFDQLSARLTDFMATDGAGGMLSADGVADWSGEPTARIDFSARRLRALRRDDRSAVVTGDGSLNLDATGVFARGRLYVDEARISVEQPAAATVPTLTGLRRVNFPDREDEPVVELSAPWLRPVQLNIALAADRRIVVFGRGLDTEWGTDVVITGTIADPSVQGSAALVRGTLDLAGQRFSFDQGAIQLAGPIRLARIDISAERASDDVTASVRVTGTPVEPKFTLESKPALPQDEVLARVLFDRSLAELSPFETAQLAAGLARLAGGQAVFDPASLVREATGLDRISFGEDNGQATVSAGKYLSDNVYLQVGTGGSGGVAAEVEWEPSKGLSIVSSAAASGDTKIAIRWKQDYGTPKPVDALSKPQQPPDQVSAPQ